MDHGCSAKSPTNQTYGCWHPPVPSFPRPAVKVNNQKYCPMYPIKHDCKAKRVAPKLENCTSTYSKWDYILESITHDQILVVEDWLQRYKSLLAKEVKKQWKLTERLGDISCRYKHLKSGGVCVKLYPEIVSAPMEEMTAQDFEKVHQRIDTSNCRLNLALQKVAGHIAELDRLYHRLDTSHDTIFLKGNGRTPSYDYVRQLIDDVYTHYKSLVSQMIYAALLLDLNDTEACVAYRTLVDPAKEDPFEVMELNGKAKIMQVRMIRCPHCSK